MPAASVGAFVRDYEIFTYLGLPPATAELIFRNSTFSDALHVALLRDLQDSGLIASLAAKEGFSVSLQALPAAPGSSAPPAGRRLSRRRRALALPAAASPRRAGASFSAAEGRPAAPKGQAMRRSAADDSSTALSVPAALVVLRGLGADYTSAAVTNRGIPAAPLPSVAAIVGKLAAPSLSASNVSGVVVIAATSPASASSAALAIARAAAGSSGLLSALSSAGLSDFTSASLQGVTAIFPPPPPSAPARDTSDVIARGVGGGVGGGGAALLLLLVVASVVVARRRRSAPTATLYAAKEEPREDVPPPPGRPVTCILNTACPDGQLQSTQGLECANGHFTCGACLADAVCRRGAADDGDSLLRCPANCGAPPFSDALLLPQLGPAAFSQYTAAVLRGREAAISREIQAEADRLQRSKEEALEEERREFTRGNVGPAARRLREAVRERILTLRCPGERAAGVPCHKAFADFDACFALNCRDGGGNGCGAGWVATHGPRTTRVLLRR